MGEKAFKSAKTEWRDVVLVCRKCSKKLNGGFGPATAGHPQPFGMPPFVLTLSDAELAAVLTHLRSAWGHRASAVSALQVQQLRGTTLD